MSADAESFDRFACSWRGYALIALIALTSALFGAGVVPVMDRDEARFAQASRQMVESGDYVRIRIQDEERSKKPVGIHWLQAASVHVFEPITHRLNEIWMYRVPSALGVLMAALATLWAGARLIGPRAAFWGAALFASGLLLGFEGMTAKTDAALCGFTTLALAALAHLYMRSPSPRGEGAGGGAKLAVKTPEQSAGHISDAGASPHPPLLQERGLALTFWAALGAAILIKGPIAPLIVALTLFPLALWERRWRWMKPLAWWAGPVLMLLIVLPWMVAIYQATNGRFFAEAIGHDLGSKVSGGSEGHSGPPSYHLLLLSVLIFPATFALPFAARLTWQTLRAPRAEETLRGLRFLIAWLLPSFVMFELTPTKLPHYPLPLYPALALLCGAGLAAALDGKWRVAKWIGVALSALVGVAAVALITQAAPLVDPATQGLVTSLAIAGALAVVAMLAMFAFASKVSMRVAAGVVCALVLSFSVRQILLPLAHGAQPTAQAAAALEAAGLTSRPLWVVGYRETSIVFSTRTDAHLTRGDDAGQRAARGDAVIVEQGDLVALQAALNARDLTFAASTAHVRARNIGNGDRVTLNVGTIQPAARN
ncbi:MAG: glycosyltransferase family 39 protein [Proteobacteria bacterium]|nr:glycosyltransferase family 39 protein [Pseudomonadota bacterium]